MPITSFMLHEMGSLQDHIAYIEPVSEEFEDKDDADYLSQAETTEFWQ